MSGALGAGLSPRSCPVSVLRRQLCLARGPGVWGRRGLHRGPLSEGERAGEASLDLVSPPAPSRSGRADLAAVYHERIDVEGHHYGPSSPQRKDALRAVDTVLKYMTKWIQVIKSKAHQAALPSRDFLPVSLTATPPNTFLLAVLSWPGQRRAAMGLVSSRKASSDTKGSPCFTGRPAGLKWPDLHYCLA